MGGNRKKFKFDKSWIKTKNIFDLTQIWEKQTNRQTHSGLQGYSKTKILPVSFLDLFQAELGLFASWA